ncbi:hypothetical protein BLA60_31850 [Actinophytocola xinjiangensis]|uniref:LppX_LprAFG lipoprotein n=1 Tax=Actinophytocola xinjiangensis TaxID=485602 RepID=A0A7Z1AWJ0_9PSEU|nr:hypothetical protein BLA60_31850 [Actinophytocola xinjiangensis]
MAVTLGACGSNSVPGTGSGTGGGSGDGGSKEAATNLAALTQQIGEKTTEKNSAHMTLAAEAAGQEINAEGDVEFSADDIKMTMDMEIPGQGSISMVFAEGIMYIEMPQELEPGKSWIKIDPNGDDAMSKSLGSTFDEMRKNADPRASLEQMKDAGEITAEEQVELNGEQTTHYSIVLDAKKMAEQQSDPEAKKAMEMMDVTELPVELWVNEDQLPVRMTMTMAMSNPASGEAIESTFQMDYTNWGEPVEVTAPSEDQIAEMPGM